MKVATIILLYGERDNLGECLKSLDKSNWGGVEHKTFVIDNNRVNLGFTGGNNKGIKQALKWGAEAVLLLNDDTIIDENTVGLLLSALYSNKSIGIVVPKIYFYPGNEYHFDRYRSSQRGKVIWYAGGRVDWNNIGGVHFGVDEVDKKQYDKTRGIEFATGCAMMIRRELLKKIGLLDDRYFLYLEDLDFSVRAIRAGYRIQYIPEAKVWHKNAQGSSVGSQLQDYYITRNRLLFGMTYASVRTKFALLKESVRFLLGGPKWKRIGVIDYFKKRWRVGSWVS